MTPYNDKILFGFSTLASTAFCAIGAIFTTGEARWIYASFAASVLTSGFLALMFKRTTETIRLVIGRCGFAVLGGVLATRPVIHYFSMVEAEMDVVAIAGMAAAVTVGTFFFGFALLNIFERVSPALAEKWFKKFTD
jgi:hypothetical protein